MSALVTLALEDAQAVFDALVSGLDFGSGFLDSEDVVALRNLAKAIGVDPMLATPKDFALSHTHVPALHREPTHMYVRRGEMLPAGWRWLETYAPDTERGTRYAGRATMGAIMICEHCLQRADAPIHRPWADRPDEDEA